MSKALGLLSGGLDSSLAAMALKRQGVAVTCIAFVTPFFGAGRAEKAARAMDIPLIVHNIGEMHLEMVKNPRYGYGKNLNPCVDCHAMMFRLAGAVMEEQGFDFLFSGEVLGQRPMSQNLTAIKTVGKYSGYPERILRPLCAKLLPVTPMEEQGLVDRAQLLDIQGRSRRRQQELAAAWGLVDYPASGGGCLLTEKSFTGRLRDLFEHQPTCTPADVELLKVGRQFRLSPQAKLTLGRNEEDNAAIRALRRPDSLLVRARGVTGPLGLVSGTPDAGDLTTAAALVASYGKGKDLELIQVEILAGEDEGETTLVEVRPMARDQAEGLQVK
ncbi:thiamine biosynthesis protein [Geoalkalibacter sp.]|uniref:thiamine biosynthesis protein n=1 Tax=Geoalkalibacter sp. TaxID=3041440 RepID=UPI00272DCA1D|nr:thiamine biosynthesis protein [Geoalkalibacter sp.]